MSPQDPFERLTLLERAQLLHDSTLRRHGDMLDRQMDAIARHEEALLRHHSQLAALRTLAHAQDATLQRVIALHADLTAAAMRLEATLAAIKDLLERRNGQ